MARCFRQFVHRSRTVIVRQSVHSESDTGKMGIELKTRTVRSHTHVRTAINPVISPKMSANTDGQTRWSHVTNEKRTEIAREASNRASVQTEDTVEEGIST